MWRKETTTINQALLLKVPMADSLTSFKYVFKRRLHKESYSTNLFKLQPAPPLTITLISFTLPSFFFCYGTVFTFHQVVLYNLLMHYVCCLFLLFIIWILSLEPKITERKDLYLFSWTYPKFLEVGAQ